MKKKNYYYCDMDGVLADFNREKDAIERFEIEKYFFLKLKPIEENCKAINDLIKKGESVRIISVSPNRNADFSKIMWLKIYIPFLKKSNIILLRPNQNKCDYMKTKQGILFDDYGKNCTLWETKKNNKSFKINNEKNIKYYLTTI